jgi:hypothetical protein
MDVIEIAIDCLLAFAAVVPGVFTAAVLGVVATVGASNATESTARSVTLRITRPPELEYDARPQWYGLSAVSRPPDGFL